MQFIHIYAFLTPNFHDTNIFYQQNFPRVFSIHGWLLDYFNSGIHWNAAPLKRAEFFRFRGRNLICRAVVSAKGKA